MLLYIRLNRILGLCVSPCALRIHSDSVDGANNKEEVFL